MKICNLNLRFALKKWKKVLTKTLLYLLSVYFILSLLSNFGQISLHYETNDVDTARVLHRSARDDREVSRNFLVTEKLQKTHKSLLETINVDKISFNRSAFGINYTLNFKRGNDFDFPYIIPGRDICKKGPNPYLVIMVPSVHTHIDTRNTIRQTWGRAADPGLWPKVGKLNKIVKLIFLFGTPKTPLGNSIVKEESEMYGDVVQADFVDSYFNLTLKSVMGLRWVAEFCPQSKYVLKADEDVFVHVKNLIDFLEKREYKQSGSVYGHALLNSDVLREGRWAVTLEAFPLGVYPTYTCGNTYVISTNIAASIYYTAGLLPYLNIEDVFVTGIVREFLSAELVDVLGFTHWFERRPVPCEFKNNIRISATKVLDYLQTAIWEGLKMNLTDCYKPIKTQVGKAKRPERTNTYQLIRDDHIFKNKTSVECSGGTFHCDLLRCIPSYRVCDKYTDCQDGTDEMNCDLYTSFTSCHEAWEAGHTQSGYYKLGNDVFECNFEHLQTDNKVKVILHNITTFINYMSTGYDKVDQDALFKFARNHKFGGNCFVEVHRICLPYVMTRVEYCRERGFNCGDYLCQCEYNVVSFTEHYITGIESHVFCGAPSPVLFDLPIFERLNEYGHIMMFRDRHFLNYAGPAYCEYSYIPKEENILCSDGKNAYAVSMKCVYEVDSLKTVIGCRDLDHLQNCESHVCKEGYVKCEDSYCIPVELVCDGEQHCPKGEDEVSCGPTTADTDVIVVYVQEDEDITEDRELTKMVSQFVSMKNQVHLIKISMSTSFSGVQSFTVRKWNLNNVHFELAREMYFVQYSEVFYRLNWTLFTTITSSVTNKTAFIFLERTASIGKVYDNLFNSLSDVNLLHLIRVRYRSSTTGLMSGYEVGGHVSTISVSSHTALVTVGRKLLDHIIADNGTRIVLDCHKGYRCEGTSVCLPYSKLCDGLNDCPLYDDEMLCGFSCPANCSCSGFSVDCKNVGFTTEDMRNISVRTRKLDLSENPQLSEHNFGIGKPLYYMFHLNISSCSIKTFSVNPFYNASNLMILDLSYNLIERLESHILQSLFKLNRIILHGNDRIHTISPLAFVDLISVRELEITDVRLDLLDKNTFWGLSLDRLRLGRSDIKTVKDFAFANLKSTEIDILSSNIHSFGDNMFYGVEDLQVLRTPAFKFCCVRPVTLAEDDCFPHKDEFSSCTDLIRNVALRALLWVIGFMAVIGNGCSLVYRLTIDRKRLTLGYGIFVTNLAVSDCLMGVYLLMIAIADTSFRDRYILYDDAWRAGSACTLAGIISTVSSESSVLFMSLITLDRILVIKYPFGQVKFNQRNGLIAAMGCWVLSLLIAVTPVFFSGYFGGNFYSRSRVCLALPLTRDRPAGWQYSITVFVGFNFVTFILIALGQCLLYFEIKKQSGKVKRETSRRRDLVIARNLLTVVATDFLCWFPIGCMGIMALMGSSISGDVYAWTAVLVLPINSALNPFLYTLSAVVARKNFNPSVDEQGRTLLETEMRRKLFKVWKLQNNYFEIRENEKITKDQSILRQPLSDLCTKKMLTPLTAVLIIYKLVFGLKILHKSGITHGHLKIEEIEVYMTSSLDIKGIRIMVDIQKCSADADEKQDVYDVGAIVRKMIVSCRPLNM